MKCIWRGFRKTQQLYENLAVVSAYVTGGKKTCG